MQKTDTGKIEQLSHNLNRFRQSMEYSLTALAKELSRLISNVESSYHEPSVRDAVRQVTMQLGEIMKLAEHVDDRLRDKVSALNFAAGQYLQTEQKILTLAQAKKEPVFKWKTSATDWMSRFNKNLWNNVTEDPGAQLSPLQILKGVLLEAKDITLESRLSSVKEDERIASLLQMLDYGSPEAQQWSREELEKIAGAFEGIARSQSAYRIYDIYNNDKYKEYIHNLANRQRDVLADLGVSEEWFKEGLSLSAFYKGSPLDACEYNPLKTDFSRMPEESELRFMIAVGLFNPTYRLWAISSYNQIEAAVRKAAEQRKQLEKLLDEYNRSASTEDIRKMQQYLKDMNLYQGEITGTYNQEFLVAVAGYQHIANTESSVAAVRRDLFKLAAYQFEVDGKITKELLDLAAAERGLGIKNNPDLKTGGLMTSITLVGVGDGVISQLWDDTRDLVELVNSTNPASIKFWTETIPAYYDFGKAVTNGDITFDEIKNIIGEAAAAEFVVPFQEIEKLSGKVFSGKATYEESQRYGRALAKAVQVVSLVTAAAKAGAKVSAKASKQISEAMSKLGDELTTPSVLSTPEGVKVPVTGTQNGGDLVVPRTPKQENFLRFQREGEVGGTGKSNPYDLDGKYTGGRTQEELDDLARDPSHAGRIEVQGIKEREVGLDLERQGILGRIIRDTQADKGGDLIDTTTGVKWDVKSFESYPNGHTSPRKGAFTVKRAMDKIYGEFDKGNNVIIDTRELIPEHVQQLRKAIEEDGIADRIIWYPT